MGRTGAADLLGDQERHRLIVARIKAEITADAYSGVLPEGPLTFSDLHQHVDANIYGGLSDEHADVSTDELVTIQEEVQEWLLSEARNRALDRPWLGVARKVLPRDLGGGQWVYRVSPTVTHFGWYEIVESRWLPKKDDRGMYLVRINRPRHLANLLRNRYYLSAAARETVREPLTEKELGNG